MPKQARLESFKYRFLKAAEEAALPGRGPGGLEWAGFLDSLDFSASEARVTVSWKGPPAGSAVFSVEEPEFYRRGDESPAAGEREAAGDPVMARNARFFSAAVAVAAEKAGYPAAGAAAAEASRFSSESRFHDEWAAGEDMSGTDVRALNEACTAPEMRCIRERLGDLRGKRLLDVGCGLGEASVYFALLGAEVTASDISKGMLDCASRLAAANGVAIKTHLAAAEAIGLPGDARFDVIYAGNLLHHVDIDGTLRLLKNHLAPGGTLATWDPLAYNPVINVYRRMATAVRTPDEHPLRTSDLRLFRRHFSRVETRYFWLTTLVIFVIMALWQRRDPNRERFWKAVVSEEGKWRPLYMPLEALDKLLLALLPPLRLLCWNVVVFCSGGAESRKENNV